MIFIIFNHLPAKNLWNTYLTTYVETKQKKKNILLLWNLISGPFAMQSNALPTELTWQEEKLWKNSQSLGFQKFHKIGGYRYHILQCNDSQKLQSLQTLCVAILGIDLHTLVCHPKTNVIKKWIYLMKLFGNVF